MTQQQLSRPTLLVVALGALAASAGSLLLLVAAIVGVATAVVWLGLPILYLAVVATRTMLGWVRHWAGRVLGTPMPVYYRPLPVGGLLARQRVMIADPMSWRDLAWLAYDATVGVAITTLAIIEAVIDLVVWFKPPGMLLYLHAVIARFLLGQPESAALTARVAELTESRARTADSSAAELRRIERDLHDGAQARLVALGMNLGLAEAQLESDPQGARALVAEARDTSAEALQELRDLVRGILPPVLADRGLDGAVRALALASPIPVTVVVEMDRPLPAPVESAAYFAVAEALANVVKHSGAGRAVITIAGDGDRLRLQVIDDGRGGADAAAGTGLAGIERRLATFDGSLHVDSPPGGPTRVAMVLSCASFSPKTLPSSGTG